jgi:microcystin-dependent protein
VTKKRTMLFVVIVFGLIASIGYCQDAITVISNGNVGIGTSNPTEKLEVAGNIKSNSRILDGTGFVMPVGSVLSFAGSIVPNGWLECDGTDVSRTTFADLFSVIRTTYGGGDGTTTFNLPNIKGKVVVGYNASETEFDTIGETSGEKAHTLTVNEIPSHNHVFTEAYGGSGVYPDADKSPSSTSLQRPSGAIGNTGGGAAHNNLQPYIALKFIIKY